MHDFFHIAARITSLKRSEVSTPAASTFTFTPENGNAATTAANGRQVDESFDNDMKYIMYLYVYLSIYLSI